MTRRRWLLASLALSLALRGSDALACGPYPPTARFWFVCAPGPSLDAFFDGTLGILDSRLAPAYLYVAYRHLSGIGLDAASRVRLAEYWGPEPLAGASEPGLPEELLSGLDVYNELQRTEDGNVYAVFFRNCLPDALETAARTYADRSQRLSPAELEAWVEVQAQVFALCSGAGPIPEPLPTTASALARADRDYQIAAAHFYAATVSRHRSRRDVSLARALALSRGAHSGAGVDDLRWK